MRAYLYTVQVYLLHRITSSDFCIKETNAALFLAVYVRAHIYMVQVYLLRRSLKFFYERNSFETVIYSAIPATTGIGQRYMYMAVLIYNLIRSPKVDC